MFEKFVVTVTGELGFDEAKGRGASQALLRFLQEDGARLGATELTALFGMAPGQVPATGRPVAAPGAQLSFRVFEKVAYSLGAQGWPIRLSSRLRKTGLALEDVVPFVSCFERFVRGEGHGDLLPGAAGGQTLRQGLVELGFALGLPAEPRPQTPRGGMDLGKILAGLQEPHRG